MIKNAFRLIALTAALAGCAIASEPTPLTLVTAPSPVSFDGDIAGQATDFVFVLVPEANPATPGFRLRTGESLRLSLPAGFKRNPAAAINADTDVNLVLTKGWPQGAVKPAGQYRVGHDEKANAMVVTASQNVATDGANAPGRRALRSTTWASLRAT